HEHNSGQSQFSLFEGALPLSRVSGGRPPCNVTGFGPTGELGKRLVWNRGNGGLVGNVECGTRSADFGVLSGEWGVRNAEGRLCRFLYSERLILYSPCLSLEPTRIGIDPGGTFTDFVIARGSMTHAFKLPSTPRNPAEAILAGVARALSVLSETTDAKGP